MSADYFRGVPKRLSKRERLKRAMENAKRNRDPGAAIGFDNELRKMKRWTKTYHANTDS